MKTFTLGMEGIIRLATPLLWQKDMPLLNAPKESVLPTLHSMERSLLKDPVKAEVYKEEMRKLIVLQFCIVFNCSHQYQGQSLNQLLLPGATLRTSLLGVLISFREHPVTVNGDIKPMFHQVHLLPEDRPLIRFLWWNLKMDEA